MLARDLMPQPRTNEDMLAQRLCSALCLRGGGGDGGVYPLTHAEMQWMTPSGMGQGGREGNKAWTHQFKDKVTEETMRLDRATLCAASSKALRAPIVVTDLGFLCNKEDLLEARAG